MDEKMGQVVEQETLGDKYAFHLVKVPSQAVMMGFPAFQLGLAREGYDYKNPEDQYNFKKELPASPKASLTKATSVLKVWLVKYKSIGFASFNRATEEKWCRLLRASGFKIESKWMMGKEIFFIK